MALSGNEDEAIDLEFVESLIVNGASVHTTDRHGQSLLHEAARDWDLGLAQFLLDYGKFEKKMVLICPCHHSSFQ